MTWYSYCRWDENRRHQRACCSSPGWYVNVESHGGDDAGWGKLLTRSPELSGNPTSWDIWVQVGGTVSLTCCKILRHGASFFTSHPKEGVLRIFIALKIHCLGRVWTRHPWCSGKHANHYTAEVTMTFVSNTLKRIVTLCCVTVLFHEVTHPTHIVPLLVWSEYPEPLLRNLALHSIILSSYHQNLYYILAYFS
jgi:hypothetical protein